MTKKKLRAEYVIIGGRGVYYNEKFEESGCDALFSSLQHTLQHTP